MGRESCHKFLSATDCERNTTLESENYANSVRVINLRSDTITLFAHALARPTILSYVPYQLYRSFSLLRRLHTNVVHINDLCESHFCNASELKLHNTTKE